MHSSHNPISLPILGRPDFHQVSQLLRDNPLVHVADVEQADDGRLGAMQGHDILKQNPEHQQMQ